jgi:hypothetical protein
MSWFTLFDITTIAIAPTIITAIRTPAMMNGLFLEPLLFGLLGSTGGGLG